VGPAWARESRQPWLSPQPTSPPCPRCPPRAARLVWDILSLIEQLLPPDSDAGEKAAAGPLGEFLPLLKRLR